MDKISLVDLREGYPNEGRFRTLQVFVCDICGALTNCVSGPLQRFTAGPYGLCPHHEDKWHRTIREKLEWLKEKPHPETYRKDLAAEIAALTTLHASKVRNDLVGEPDLTQRRPVMRTGGVLRVC